MWKFQDFSIIQILREIDFGDCTSFNYCQFGNFRGSEFWFGKFQPWKSAIIHENLKSKHLNVLKKAHFARLEFQKLISRKIWVIEKSWNFPLHCVKVVLFYKVNFFGINSLCGNFRNLLSLRFYVKSIFGIMEVQTLPFLTIFQLWI